MWHYARCHHLLSSQLFGVHLVSLFSSLSALPAPSGPHRLRPPLSAVVLSVVPPYLSCPPLVTAASLPPLPWVAQPDSARRSGFPSLSALVPPPSASSIRGATCHLSGVPTCHRTQVRPSPPARVGPPLLSVAEDWLYPSPLSTHNSAVRPPSSQVATSCLLLPSILHLPVYLHLWWK